MVSDGSAVIWSQSKSCRDLVSVAVLLWFGASRNPATICCQSKSCWDLLPVGVLLGCIEVGLNPAWISFSRNPVRSLYQSEAYWDLVSDAALLVFGMNQRPLEEAPGPRSVFSAAMLQLLGRFPCCPVFPCLPYRAVPSRTMPFCAVSCLTNAFRVVLCPAATASSHSVLCPCRIIPLFHSVWCRAGQTSLLIGG